MPELPEVETITRSLRKGGHCGPSILGRRLQKVEITWERTLVTPSLAELQQLFQSQLIIDISRRGKFIVLHLEKGFILFHLRMSGDLRVELPQQGNTASNPRLPHDRAIFYFQDGVQLVFNDPRKFGRIWIVEETGPILKKLGPEPLDDSFTADDLYNKLHKCRCRIKPLLMDQQFIAGIGNIYADEALFVARINPQTQASRLTKEASFRLHGAIRQVLMNGIATNGASIDWVYRGGSFQNNFKVYQRTSEPCLVCGTPIERQMIGQRSSHFCPTCQPKE